VETPKGAFAIQLGPAKPTTTLYYAKWLFSGGERFVNVNTQLEKVGTMRGHQVDIKEKEDEKFDGPCMVKPTARC
jgi:hypothetical protein